ncbi:MAG: hypothetical protein RSA84_21690, partial [Acinetobacter sp.]
NANPLNWSLTRTTPLQLRDERQCKMPNASPITPEQVRITMVTPCLRGCSPAFSVLIRYIHIQNR